MGSESKLNRSICFFEHAKFGTLCALHACYSDHVFVRLPERTPLPTCVKAHLFNGTHPLCAADKRDHCPNTPQCSFMHG